MTSQDERIQKLEKNLKTQKIIFAVGAGLLLLYLAHSYVQIKKIK